MLNACLYCASVCVVFVFISTRFSVACCFSFPRVCVSFMCYVFVRLCACACVLVLCCSCIPYDTCSFGVACVSVLFIDIDVLSCNEACVCLCVLSCVGALFCLCACVSCARLVYVMRVCLV